MEMLKKLNEENKKSNSRYIIHFIVKAFLYLVLSLLVIVAVLFLFYFIDKMYNKKMGTGKNPLFNAYVIVSPSMVPTININDAVVVLRQDAKKLKVGDIITFSSNDSSYYGLTVTHRIVAKNKSDDGHFVFTTKGDHNNSEDDALVEEKKIYGKVMLRIPKIGYIRSFLTTPLGFILCIGLPALLVITYDIIKVVKKLKRFFELSNDQESLEII